MTATQLKLAIGALVIAGATTAIIIHHQAQARLREQNQSTQQQKQVSIAKMDDAKNLVIQFLLYANDHQGQFPTNFDQVDSYSDKYPTTGTNSFKIVYQGSQAALTKPGNTILIEETEPWPVSNGKWARAYGFADGHSVIQVSANRDFSAFEQQHTFQPPVPSQ
jgi:hypothetical protein